MRDAKPICKSILVFLLCAVYCQAASAEWRRHQSGTLAWLRSVYFADADHGWISGSKGTLLSTNDGGITWQKKKAPTNDNIWDVYFSGIENGWLLCESDIYSGGNSHSYLLRTLDGGSSWERIDFADSGNRIVRFFFTAGGRGFAVGEGGLIWEMLDDPKSWKRKVLPWRSLVLAGTFTDDLNGIVVGGGGKILVTSDGGVEWNDAIVPAGSNTRLNAVFFIDPKSGWAAGNAGKIYTTKNGGKTWYEQASGIKENLSDIVFISDTEGVAVGDKGTIIETKTGGDTWVTADTGVKSKLERVVFIGKRGFAIGFGGVILTNLRP